jgi:trimeric autotransporter adhesin
MSVKRLALVVLAAMGAIAATASPAFALSATADTSAWETNGKVKALTLSGNTLYVGGKFGLLRAQGGTPKIKLKSVGKIDATTGVGIPGWGPIVTYLGAAGQVNALGVSADGSTLYIGGKFDMIGSTPVKNFAAVSTSTGAVIPAFTHNFGNQVHVIVVGPNLIYVGGAFKQVDGQAKGNIVALQPDGAVSSTFTAVANNNVRSMALAPDGTTLFVGGNFTTMDGVSRVSVARVNLDTGALDPWAIPSGVIVAPQVGWALLPVGDRLYGGFGRGPNYAAAFRLDNGAVGTQVWRFNTVGNDESLVMSPDGTRLFVGGHFGTAVLTQTVCGNQQLHGLMSLNPATGALFCDWLPAITPQGGNYTGAWAMVKSGSNLYVGGFIDAINGVPHTDLVRFPL